MTSRPVPDRLPSRLDAREGSLADEPTMRHFERLLAIVALLAAIALNAARPA